MSGFQSRLHMQEAHPVEHGLQRGSALCVQGPGHVAGGALQVFHALLAAFFLSALQEGVVGGPHALQEEVMAVQELAIALQQEHRDRQHAPEHVRKAVAQLHETEVSRVRNKCLESCESGTWQS